MRFAPEEDGTPAANLWMPRPRFSLLPMDQARRDRLQARQAMMRLRLRRQALSATFREVARELCGEGVRLSKSMPAANERSLGPLATGPGEDEELHFDWMGNGRVAHWSTDSEAAGLVRVAIAACCPPHTLVTVVWNPFDAGLRLGAGDLSDHARRVLRRDWTTWIVAARPSRWIIQVGVRSATVAYSPDVPDRTGPLGDAQ
jgi:hypothetical protein